ncbi:MAG TPA: hypothetical protein DGB85_07370 [Deltaproteobacteria bacterium]|nr:hypothetical protein [Deltaproteobacteria bacterium]
MFSRYNTKSHKLNTKQDYFLDSEQQFLCITSAMTRTEYDFLTNPPLSAPNTSLIFVQYD